MRLPLLLLAHLSIPFLVLWGPAGCSGDEEFPATGPGSFTQTSPTPTPSGPPTPTPTPTPGPIEDTEGPTAIFDLAAATGAVPGEITLAWTAPRDSSLDSVAAYYDIRYQVLPLNEALWHTAIPLTGEPAPGAPGTPQAWNVGGLQPGLPIYVAARSVDAAGNTSPLSNVASAIVRGQEFRVDVLSATSGNPQAGIAVSFGGLDQVSASDGGVLFENLPPLAAELLAAGSADPNWYPARTEVDTRIPLDQTLPDLWIPLVPRLPYPVPGYLGFMKFLRVLTATEANLLQTKLKNWPAYPVKLYWPDFVNALGTDYGEAARLAVETWEIATGLDLFEAVPSPPARGARISPVAPSQISPYIAITSPHTLDEKGRLSTEIKLRNSFEPGEYDFLIKVFIHELGHVLGLAHSTHISHMMYLGLPLPDSISSEEVECVKTLLVLPHGFDMALYDLP